MDGSLVMHHDEKEAVGSPGDILVRRLKNRERQRRYRARKRQEADLRKASSVDQSTPSPHYQQLPTEIVSVPVEVDISVNITSPDFSTRVHCQRDWKKDARTAHIHKKQETCPVGPTNSVTTTPSAECGLPADLQSSSSSIPIVDNSVTQGSQYNRRHWKVEARNKRSLE
ncbi:hypothetical protein ACS0TY_011084 [Phlomoides rotata]